MTGSSGDDLFLVQAGGRHDDTINAGSGSDTIDFLSHATSDIARESNTGTNHWTITFTDGAGNTTTIGPAAIIATGAVLAAGGYRTPSIEAFSPADANTIVVKAGGQTIKVPVAVKDLDKPQPVMQMKIGYNLKAADGAKVQNAIYNTINVVGDLRAELHVGEFRLVPKK